MKRLFALFLAVLIAGSAQAATVNITPTPIQQFNQNGTPCSGCQLFSYAAGTTNPLATYTSSTGSTPNTNPIILDANGQANVWLIAGDKYKLILSPATDTNPPTHPFWTEDQLTGVNDFTAFSGGNISYTLNRTGAVATTVGAKLNQVVNITDYGATCNGTTNDNAAWTALISSIGATPTTVVVPCASKISENLTFGAATVVQFTNNGEIIGTAGTEVVQFQRQIMAGGQQIFSNLVPQADTGMTVIPEWFGAAKNGTSDDSSAFNLAYTMLENVGGVIQMSAGNYGLANPINNVKSHVSLLGAGLNATVLTATATNISALEVTGVLGTPLADDVFNGFNIVSATPGTSNVGIALAFTALAKLSDIQVAGFLTGVQMECATDSSFQRMGTTYSAATNGFIGWNILGGGGCVGGNESSTWRDTFVQGTGAFGGPTGQVGYRASGLYVSDLYFSNAAAGEVNFGYFFDYSTPATAGGFADVIIQNPIVDGFTAQGIFINALPAQQMVTISDGWLNPVSVLAETDAVFVDNSAGAVQITGMQIGGEANFGFAVGVRVANSSNTHVSNTTFNDNNFAIEETGSARGVYTGNSVINQSVHPATAQISLTGSVRSMVTNNSFDGFATNTVVADSTSTGVGVVGNTFNAATLSSPRVSNSSSGPVGGSDGSTGLNSGT